MQSLSVEKYSFFIVIGIFNGFSIVINFDDVSLTTDVSSILPRISEAWI